MASFNDDEKNCTKFASARAKRESWQELLLGVNYSLTSTGAVLKLSDFYQCLTDFRNN